MYGEDGKKKNGLRVKALKGAIAQLPTKMKFAFELCELQGKTIEEIANEMHISMYEAHLYLSDSARFLKDYFRKHPELKVVVD